MFNTELISVNYTLQSNGSEWLSSRVVVSVSPSRSWDVPTSHQRLISTKLSTSRSREADVSVSVSGHLCLVPKTVSWWACRWRCTQC